MREAPKPKDLSTCDMRTITKITQVLELIKLSGFNIAPLKLEQLSYFS